MNSRKTTTTFWNDIPNNELALNIKESQNNLKTLKTQLERVGNNKKDDPFSFWVILKIT